MQSVQCAGPYTTLVFLNQSSDFSACIVMPELGSPCYAPASWMLYMLLTFVATCTTENDELYHKIWLRWCHHHVANNILHQDPCHQHIAEKPVLEARQHVHESGTCSVGQHGHEKEHLGLFAICLLVEDPAAVTRTLCKLHTGLLTPKFCCT